MADLLWRRLGAAPLSVIAGAPGLLAGLGLGRGTQPASVNVDPAADASAAKTKPLTISSRNVLDGSLLLRDFKKGALEKSFYTRDQTDRLLEFQPRLSSANQLSEVLVRGYDPVKKKEIVGRARPSLLLGGYAKTGDTAVDSQKLEGRPAAAFVLGSGSVLTASRVAGAGRVPLLTIPGALGVEVAVDAKSGGAVLTLANLGGDALTLAATSTQPATGTIAPGGALDVILPPGAPGVLQFLGCPACVHTLNVTAVSRPGGQVEVVAQ